MPNKSWMDSFEHYKKVIGLIEKFLLWIEMQALVCRFFQNKSTVLFSKFRCQILRCLFFVGLQVTTEAMGIWRFAGAFTVALRQG
jgi:hypothetical protein